MISAVTEIKTFQAVFKGSHLNLKNISQTMNVKSDRTMSTIVSYLLTDFT
jgi:hypothetical protein